MPSQIILNERIECSANELVEEMVCGRRLELPTLGVSDRCSDQLSYPHRKPRRWATGVGATLWNFQRIKKAPGR